MGDKKIQPDAQRLRQESQELLAELMAKLHELDEAEGRQRRESTPEERRRSFRLIQGGATVVGAAAVWAWETARKPALAVVVGTGTLTTAALVTAPMIEPGTASELPPPAVVSETPVRDMPAEQGTQRERPTAEPVAETPPPSAVAEAPVAPVEEPFTPAPTQTPKPSLRPSPSPIPSASATAEVQDLVEIEVTAEDGEACVDAGLVGLELAVCLDGAR